MDRLVLRDALLAVLRHLLAEQLHLALQGAAPTSPQGRYAIALDIVGGEAYRATAVAQGVQAEDRACATLTLEVRQGFAQPGPAAGCWNR